MLLRPFLARTRGIIRVQLVLGLVILFHPFFIIIFVPFSFFFISLVETPFPTRWTLCDFDRGMESYVLNEKKRNFFQKFEA